MKSPYGIMSRPLSKEGKETWDRIFTKEKAVKVDIKVTYNKESGECNIDPCEILLCDECPTQNEKECHTALYKLIKREGLILNITAE